MFALFDDVCLSCLCVDVCTAPSPLDSNSYGLLSSTTTSWFVLGSAISATPTVSGGPLLTWSVSPSLPAGLSLNTNSGAISGTVTSTTAANAQFNVTVLNGAGSSWVMLTMTIIQGMSSTHADSMGRAFVVRVC